MPGAKQSVTVTLIFQVWFHCEGKADLSFLDIILFQVNESRDLQAAVFRDTQDNENNNRTSQVS